MSHEASATRPRAAPLEATARQKNSGSGDRLKTQRRACNGPSRELTRSQPKRDTQCRGVGETTWARIVPRGKAWGRFGDGRTTSGGWHRSRGVGKATLLPQRGWYRYQVHVRDGTLKQDQMGTQSVTVLGLHHYQPQDSLLSFLNDRAQQHNKAISDGRKHASTHDVTNPHSGAKERQLRQDVKV